MGTFKCKNSKKVCKSKEIGTTFINQIFRYQAYQKFRKNSTIWEGTIGTIPILLHRW